MMASLPLRILTKPSKKQRVPCTAAGAKHDRPQHCVAAWILLDELKNNAEPSGRIKRPQEEEWCANQERHIGGSEGGQGLDVTRATVTTATWWGFKAQRAALSSPNFSSTQNPGL